MNKCTIKVQKKRRLLGKGAKKALTKKITPSVADNNCSTDAQKHRSRFS